MPARIVIPALILGGMLFVPLCSRAQAPALTPEAIASHPAWQAFESWNRGINSWFGVGFKDMLQGLWQNVQNFRLPRYEDFNWPGIWNTVGGGVSGYVQNAQRDIGSSNPNDFGSKVSEYAKTAGDNAPGVWAKIGGVGGQVLNWLFNSSSTP